MQQQMFALCNVSDGTTQRKTASGCNLQQTYRLRWDWDNVHVLQAQQVLLNQLLGRQMSSNPIGVMLRPHIGDPFIREQQWN